LIAARVFQGLAGAIMTPQVLAIATVTFPPEERGQSFSLFGLSAGLAAVAGPIIGGLLIGANFGGLDWRPIFLVNVPIGLLAVVLGWFIIPRPPGHPDLKNDYVGIGLFGVSIVALVYPIIEGRSYGWPAWAWVMMGAAVVGLALFVLWERRRAAANEPQLLNYSLVTNPQFLLGAGVLTIFSSGIPGFFMVISLLLQAGFGFTPLESGLTNTPFSVGVLVISLIAGRFGQSYLRTRAAVSAVLLTGGMVWLHYIIGGIGDTIDHWWFLPPLFIAGMGLGLGFSSLFQLVLSAVPPRDAGAGAGSLQAFQQVGGAIGVALIGQIFFSMLESARDWGATSMHEAFTVSAATATWYQIVAFGAVFLLVFLLKGKPTAPGQGTAPAAAPPVPMEA
jgi:MFS family permease